MPRGKHGRPALANLLLQAATTGGDADGGAADQMEYVYHP